MYHSVRECKGRLVIEIIPRTLLIFSDSVGRLQKTMPYEKTFGGNSSRASTQSTPTTTSSVSLDGPGRRLVTFPGSACRAQVRVRDHDGVSDIRAYKTKKRNTKKNTHAGAG